MTSYYSQRFSADFLEFELKDNIEEFLENKKFNKMMKTK